MIHFPQFLVSVHNESFMERNHINADGLMKKLNLTEKLYAVVVGNSFNFRKKMKRKIKYEYSADSKNVLLFLCRVDKC